METIYTIVISEDPHGASEAINDRFLDAEQRAEMVRNFDDGMWAVYNVDYYRDCPDPLHAGLHGWSCPHAERLDTKSTISDYGHAGVYRSVEEIQDEHLRSLGAELIREWGPA